METDNLSEEAKHLIRNARGLGTQTRYKSSWNNWNSWCSERQIDPVRCPINHITEFLTNLFSNGREYWTINSYRSAISAYHIPEGNTPVGQTIQITTLMKGISKSRPPQPKYPFIWDIQHVLDYINNLPNNDSLDDKTLTLKLTMLLSLCAIQRTSEVARLNTKFMANSKTKYVFAIPGTVKHSRVGKRNPEIAFHAFDQNLKLCPVQTLDDYINKTSAWRQNSDTVLLSYVKPHKSISQKTLARWLTELLKAAGINTNQFKAQLWIYLPHARHTRSHNTCHGNQTPIA